QIYLSSTAALAVSAIASDSGPLAVNLAAGTPIVLRVSTAAKACGTDPADANISFNTKGSDAFLSIAHKLKRSLDRPVRHTEQGLGPAGVTQSDHHIDGDPGSPLRSVTRDELVNWSRFV